MLDDEAVVLQLLSEKELEEVLLCAEDKKSSPFLVLERWMEVIGTPSSPRWVRSKFSASLCMHGGKVFFVCSVIV